jgi:hypothetical protein
MKKSISNLLFLGLFLSLIACGGEKKETETADSTSVDSATTENKSAEIVEDTPAEDRMTLLNVADADFKCDVKATKITKLVINGQEQKADNLTQVFAQYWGTSQTVVITNFELDKAKYFAFTCDVKKMEPSQVRIELGFNRFKKAENGSKTIAPELGEYANMRDGFGLNAAIYTKDKAEFLIGKAFLKAISTTKICTTFELKTEDGKYTVSGEVIADNNVKE